MKYDRARIKLRAKDILRRADPQPWTVTLIHWFLSADLLALCLLFLLAAGAFSGRKLAPVPVLVAALLSLVLILVVLVFSSGYVSYTLRLWFSGQGGPMDLFAGFFRGAEILVLWGLVLLICLLWALGGELAARLLLLLLRNMTTDALPFFFPVLIRLALGVVVIDRQLSYAMALHILLYQPQLSALDALAKSRRLMSGRKGDYLLLLFSFLGWLLLAALIALLPCLLGVLIQLGSTTLSFMAGVVLPEWFLIPFLAAGIVAAIPLLLWLASYLSISVSGFYAAAIAPPFPGASPTPIPQGGRRLQ